MKRKLIQKLQQLLDININRKDLATEIKTDILNLKTSKEDYHYLSLEDKYKNFE